MKRFLLALFLIFFVFCLVLALGLLATLGGGPGLSRASVLEWELDGGIPEGAPSVPFPFPGLEMEPTMAEVWSALTAARHDRHLKGILVRIGNPAIGLARAEEIRRLLGQVRQAGKFVECYLETAGEGSNGTLAYFLASACGGVRIAPAGELNLLGLHAPGLFLRATLDKLKIEPLFNSRGTYKSAVETYTRTDYSEAAEEAVRALLDAEFEVLVSGIATGRGLEPELVRQLIDRAPFSAEEALEAKLIDGIAYPDELLAHLATVVGEEPSTVAIRDYLTGRIHAGSGDVAVLFASGVIVHGASGQSGLSGEQYLGSDDFTDELRSLAEDDDVEAVVLRVDSPGGSALASDLILREVERLAEVKPVVASMGDVAASGGYYVVAKAPTIIAEASTLTGSIGVFGGKLVTRDFEGQLLGITRDPQKRGVNADLYSSLNAYTPEQSAEMQAAVDRIYVTFLDHVATGRKMATGAVDAVAQGRVWAGSDARARGLVDELGGLERAIALAAERAGLDPDKVAVSFHPEPPDLLDWLRAQTGTRAVHPWEEVAVRLLREPRGAHLRLPPEWAALAAPFE
ncbi:MAG TPA: S49 family peptidase [Thermoanaerobaculia bacterium]|nr:S49 family peptidase [Thermoanaerobaculia bacterium]